MGALYAIDFPNGKRYIGITTGTLQRRWTQHKQAAARGESTLLYRAMRKYGTATISALAEYDDWDALCIVEQRAIAAYNTMEPHGYNLCAGGYGVHGLVRTPEHVAKISASLKGKRQTDEVIARMAETQRRRLADPAARQRISQALTGKRHSEETKRKMSASQRGRQVADDTRQKIAASLRGRTHSDARRLAMVFGRRRADTFRNGRVAVHLATVEALSGPAEFSMLEKPRHGTA